MSLSDLAALGSFVSGLAVLVSLIFLYFQLRQVGTQIRQAERNQKAAIGQGRINRMVELALRTAEPGLSGAMANVFTNSPDLKSDELFQFLNYSRAMFLNAEDTFYQHQNGLLEEQQYEGFVAALRNFFGLPAARLMWLYQRAAHGAAFVAFADDLIKASPLDALVVPEKQLSSWRAAIEALIAGEGKRFSSTRAG